VTHLAEMVNGLSKGVVAKTVGWVLRTICEEGFLLVIDLGNRKSITKRLEEKY